jgi:Mor family transcriptional regulator
MSISKATRDERILERWTAGESVRALAERYGITPALVSQIVNAAIIGKR